MNKYLRALGVYPTGALKMGTLKLLHGGRFHGPALCQVSPRTELTVDRGATLSIGAGCEQYGGESDTIRECILRADENLYANKNQQKALKIS